MMTNFGRRWVSKHQGIRPACAIYLFEMRDHNSAFVVSLQGKTKYILSKDIKDLSMMGAMQGFHATKTGIHSVCGKTRWAMVGSSSNQLCTIPRSLRRFGNVKSNPCRAERKNPIKSNILSSFVKTRPRRATFVVIEKWGDHNKRRSNSSNSPLTTRA